MGKPLGLGSVKINSNLYLSDRQKRYQDFFAEWNNLGEAKQMKEFKKAFEMYILKNETSLWETERLKELKAMLDFDNKPKNDETKYIFYNGSHNTITLQKSKTERALINFILQNREKKNIISLFLQRKTFKWPVVNNKSRNQNHTHHQKYSQIIMTSKS
jgi:hypothetical protein